MPDIFLHIFAYILAFTGIWIGSGLAIESVEKISKSLKMSSFLVSFFILGIFTSISEFSVGINAIIDNDAEIYVGNLIGASIVLFLLVIPLLAVFGNNIKITNEFRGYNLPASLVVVALPVILALDGTISRSDAIISSLLYIFLVIVIESKRGFVKSIAKISKANNHNFGSNFLKIAFSITLIFISSKFVVDETIYFARLFNVTSFLISLMVISIGTNVPELSLAIRSFFIKNHQIAFGDYVGSAAFNTFLLGFLTIIFGGPVKLTNSYVISLLFLVVGLGLFYIFAKTKNTISVKEGLVLLTVYLVFLITEVYIHI